MECAQSSVDLGSAPTETEREMTTMAKKMNNINSTPFTGCTIVVTGKLEHSMRNGINDKTIALVYLQEIPPQERRIILFAVRNRGVSWRKQRSLK